MKERRPTQNTSRCTKVFVVVYFVWFGFFLSHHVGLLEKLIKMLLSTSSAQSIPLSLDLLIYILTFSWQKEGTVSELSPLGMRKEHLQGVPCPRSLIKQTLTELQQELGGGSHSSRALAVGSLEAETPLEASREWGWRWGAVQRPAGSPATKSTLPQMSALGLRPLATVYLLTSFFKISQKSLLRKHNRQNFSAGVERKQSISFHALVWSF